MKKRRIFFILKKSTKARTNSPNVSEYKEGLETENFHKGVTTARANTAQKTNSNKSFDKKEKKCTYAAIKEFFAIDFYPD